MRWSAAQDESPAVRGRCGGRGRPQRRGQGAGISTGFRRALRRRRFHRGGRDGAEPHRPLGRRGVAAAGFRVRTARRSRSAFGSRRQPSTAGCARSTRRAAAAAMNVAKVERLRRGSALGSGISGPGVRPCLRRRRGPSTRGVRVRQLREASPANGIASAQRFGRWSAPGSGVSGVDYPYVSALLWDGGQLYVGGRFTAAGGVTVNHVAVGRRGLANALGGGCRRRRKLRRGLTPCSRTATGGTVAAAGDFSKDRRDQRRFHRPLVRLDLAAARFGRQRLGVGPGAGRRWQPLRGRASSPPWAA